MQCPECTTPLIQPYPNNLYCPICNKWNPQNTKRTVDPFLPRRKLHLILELDVHPEADDEQVASVMHDKLLAMNLTEVPWFIDLFGVAIMKEE